MFSAVSSGVPSFGDKAWHAPVSLAQTAALPANTKTDNTLTADANGALALDGSNPQQGARVLIWQSGTRDGIYDVTDPGSGSTPWILTRSADARFGVHLGQGVSVWVVSGDRYQRTLFVSRDSDWTPGSGLSLFTEQWDYAPLVTVVTSSGTHTLDSMCRYVDVEVVGGGGAGGGGAATGVGQSSVGAGGGAGGYARGTYDVVTTPSSWTVTVGAGGTGNSGAAGNNGSASSATDGTVTLTGNGGNGGGVAGPGAGTGYAAGGTGGTASGGDVNVQGSDGQLALIHGAVAHGSGFGGMSLLGGSRRAGIGASGGTGYGYGSGGGGSLINASTGATTGGDGADGVVIFREYLRG